MSIKLAVLGQENIEKYSLSPLIQNTFLKENSIDGNYRAIPVLPENLKEVLEELKNNGYRGVNLTIPHKINSIKFLDSLDDTASKIGAVNTVLFKDNKMIGYNTDCYGFIENLNINIRNWKNIYNKVLIFGAGGATRAVIYGLKNTGIYDIIILNRTREKAKLLAEEFDCEYDILSNAKKYIKDRNLIVNTTSAGMNNTSPLDIDLKSAGENTVVYDIIYTPLLTPLLKQAKELNLQTLDGLGMLLFQAVKAFEIWFNIKPNISENLIEKCLEKLNEKN